MLSNLVRLLNDQCPPTTDDSRGLSSAHEREVALAYPHTPAHMAIKRQALRVLANLARWPEARGAVMEAVQSLDQAFEDQVKCTPSCLLHHVIVSSPMIHSLFLLTPRASLP